MKTKKRSKAVIIYTLLISIHAILSLIMIDVTDFNINSAEYPFGLSLIKQISPDLAQSLPKIQSEYIEFLLSDKITMLVSTLLLLFTAIMVYSNGVSLSSRITIICYHISAMILPIMSYMKCNELYQTVGVVKGFHLLKFKFWGIIFFSIWMLIIAIRPRKVRDLSLEYLWWSPCLYLLALYIPWLSLYSPNNIYAILNDVSFSNISTEIILLIIYLIANLALLFEFRTQNLQKYPRQQVTFSHTDGYFSMLTHVLLLIFTYIFWYYIWIHRTTKYLLCYPNDFKHKPSTTILLCLFVPFYALFWLYHMAQHVDTIAKTKGIHSEIALPTLLLSIFFTIAAPIVLQHKINEIEQPTVATVTKDNISETATDHTTLPIEDIKKLKALLDDGIITEEEFETKKKQLLNL